MRRMTKESFWIKKLITLREVLGDQDMADILLVWSRFKPAAMVEVSYFSSTRFSKKKFNREISVFKRILGKLGLHYQLYINYPNYSRELTRYSYIATDKKILEKLVAANTEKNTRRRRLRTGVLLGYPKTAAEAFASKQVLTHWPSEILRKKELKFLNFRISRYWRKEFEYVKKRSEIIKKISPELYQRILNKPKQKIF